MLPIKKKTNFTWKALYKFIQIILKYIRCPCQKWLVIIFNDQINLEYNTKCPLQILILLFLFVVAVLGGVYVCKFIEPRRLFDSNITSNKKNHKTLNTSIFHDTVQRKIVLQCHLRGWNQMYYRHQRDFKFYHFSQFYFMKHLRGESLRAFTGAFGIDGQVKIVSAIFQWMHSWPICVHMTNISS